jgi:hypothetical protein
MKTTRFQAIYYFNTEGYEKKSVLHQIDATRLHILTIKVIIRFQNHVFVKSEILLISNFKN